MQEGRKGPAQADDMRCYRCSKENKRLNKARAHENRVQSVYGLEPGDYDELYDAQDGLCAMCKRATGARKKLAVDHDHDIEELGKASVRGLLCGPCNQIVGHARNDPAFFDRGAEYLRNPPAWRVFWSTSQIGQIISYKMARLSPFRSREADVHPES